jgi:hypothetical protein
VIPTQTCWLLGRWPTPSLPLTSLILVVNRKLSLDVAGEGALCNAKHHSICATISMPDKKNRQKLGSMVGSKLCCMHMAVLAQLHMSNC